MFSLPASSTTQDSSVTVAETEEDIKPFLSVISGEGGKKGGVLESLDEVGWEKLGELADKYDSAVVMLAVEKRIWYASHYEDSFVKGLTDLRKLRVSSSRFYPRDLDEQTSSPQRHSSKSL
ncbi:hypothetical protein JCM11641_001003 [Rhodosporidiobolus odoratus]